MLESIISLGAVSQASLGAIGSKIQDIKYEIPATEKKPKQELYVCKIKFNTENKTFSFDLNEGADKSTALTYRYIGGAQGQKPQWHMSRTIYKHILTRSFTDMLREHGNGLPDLLKSRLQLVKDLFYANVEKEKKGKVREFEVVDFHAFHLPFQVDESPDFDTYVKNNFTLAFKTQFPNSNEKSIALYVVYIDELCLPQCEEYEGIILNEVSNAGNTAGEQSLDHVCFQCGSRKDIMENMEMGIKYFITDKISFAQDTNKNNFFKSFTLCRSCHEKLRAGETFMANNLRTRLVGLPIYVIPHFIFDVAISELKLRNISGKLKGYVSAMDSFSGIEAVKQGFENMVEDDLFDGEDYFLTNIIFFESSNSATKIKCFIKDIDPGLMREILRNMNETNKLYQGTYSRFPFNLNAFYHILPKVQSSKGGGYAKKQLLDWVSAVFTKNLIDKNSILNHGLKAAAKEIHGENPDNCLETIININKIFCFLQLHDCLTGEKGVTYMAEETGTRTQVLEDFMVKSGYDDEKKALFLLGALCSEIGYREQKRVGKKRILDKLNVNGLDEKGLIKLADVVFVKLKQLDILAYHEMLYAECMMLLNTCGKTLSIKENLFYILTGYSIATYRGIKEASERKKAKAGGDANYDGNYDEQ